MNGGLKSAGRLSGLAEHANRLEKDLQQSRREANDLRGENERLKERLERKEQRITELLEEKFGLADQLQAKMIEVLELQSSHNEGQKDGEFHKASELSEPQASTEQSEPQAGKAIRKPGVAFTIMPTSDRDDGSASKDSADEPNLQEWVTARRPSNMKPTLLTDVPWLLSAVPEEERTTWKEIIEEEAMVEDDGGGDDAADAPTFTPFAADAGRGIKRRRLDSQDAAFHDRRDSVALNRDDTANDPIDIAPRGRSPFRGRKGSNYKRPGRYHKAVCEHCWLTGEPCNLSPACRTCVRDGVRCVRKLCDEGRRCQCPKCPRLHPGQWDERDPEFVVEEGRMPRK